MQDIYAFSIYSQILQIIKSIFFNKNRIAYTKYLRIDDTIKKLIKK